MKRTLRQVVLPMTVTVARGIGHGVWTSVEAQRLIWLGTLGAMISGCMAFLRFE